MALTEKTLSVPSISCGHCKMSIEGAVTPLPGVDRVAVDVAHKQVRLAWDEAQTSLATIVDTIEGQGFDVVSE